MYSYEDRLRAVRLYIKLGLRLRATIRQLGYPTKNSLKSWHQEYEQRHDLVTGYVRPPKYSHAQKALAVDHFLEHGRCLTATVRALGYPGRGSLAAWVQELHPQALTRVVGRSHVHPAPTPEVKHAAVMALCMRSGGAQAIADEVGVSRPTLYNWKTQLLGHEAPASMKRPKNPPPDLERAELEKQLDELRRNIHLLQLEQDVLKKANELIKKDAGIDQCLLTNREKTQLVDALSHDYTLADLLNEVGLARSSYGRTARGSRDAQSPCATCPGRARWRAAGA